LVTANYRVNTVSVLLGNGDGTFDVKTDYLTGQRPGYAAVSDVNADGKEDLVTANDDAHTVAVLLGNGDALRCKDGYATPHRAGCRCNRGFQCGWQGGPNQPRTRVAHSFGDVGRRQWSVYCGSALHNRYAPRSPFAVDDLNADGNPDLAVASYGGNAVSVLLGNSNGTFAARTDYPTSHSPASVAIGDFNVDGRPGLVTANQTISTVSVLSGNGDGSFATRTDYFHGQHPGVRCDGDVNADGKLDVVTANQGGNSVSVLLGIGNGSFAAKTDYPTDIAPKSVRSGTPTWTARRTWP